MKKNPASIAVVVCLAAIAIACLWAQSAHSQAAEEGATRWEHLALTHDVGAGLTTRELSGQIIQLGNDGWQLVDVEGISKAGTTTHTIYFFKRQK